MIRHRPCGECRALVPADTGCAHWKPRASAPVRHGWVRGRARGAVEATPPSVPTQETECTCLVYPHMPTCNRVTMRILTDGQEVQ